MNRYKMHDSVKGLYLIEGARVRLRDATRRTGTVLRMEKDEQGKIVYIVNLDVWKHKKFFARFYAKDLKVIA